MMWFRKGWIRFTMDIHPCVSFFGLCFLLMGVKMFLLQGINWFGLIRIKSRMSITEGYLSFNGSFLCRKDVIFRVTYGMSLWSWVVLFWPLTATRTFFVERLRRSVLGFKKCHTTTLIGCDCHRKHRIRAFYCLKCRQHCHPIKTLQQH